MVKGCFLGSERPLGRGGVDAKSQVQIPPPAIEKQCAPRSCSRRAQRPASAVGTVVDPFTLCSAGVRLVFGPVVKTDDKIAKNPC